jgi:Cof subfamily protein (haloacid dehalogenase superfamily)
MKYKALFLDVDGTVVVHGINNLPSGRVTGAIRQAREKIHICLATSRPLYISQKILKHLQLSGPCVMTGGTQIYDPVKKKMIMEFPLKKTYVDSVYAYFRKHNIDIHAFDGTTDKPFHGEQKRKKTMSMYVPEIDTLKADKTIKELQQIADVNIYKIPSWTPGMMSLDITTKEASKLHGIVEVAKLLNIKTHEMIGVGNGYNDFPLLMACGLKIAMGNAVPELKAIADFVAPSVEEDGVATVIEKFILNQ